MHQSAVGSKGQDAILKGCSPKIAQFAYGMVPSGKRAPTSATLQQPPMLHVSSLETVLKEPVNLVALIWPKSQTPVPHLSMANVNRGDSSFGITRSRKVGVPIANLSIVPQQVPARECAWNCGFEIRLFLLPDILSEERPSPNIPWICCESIDGFEYHMTPTCCVTGGTAPKVTTSVPTMPLAVKPRSYPLANVAFGMDCQVGLLPGT